MAGVAANVSAFNTVVTYDIYQDYIRPDRDPGHYVTVGRIATVGGVLVSIATAFIAKGYDNVMNYVQLLFSYFNAPLFATFLCAIFWRRATPWGGFFGLVAGTAGAAATHILYSKDVIHFGSALAADFTGAAIAFLADVVVTVAVSLVTRPKPEAELEGLVYGLTDTAALDRDLPPEEHVWWRNPKLLAGGAVVLIVILNIIFI
jgi:SSS family solute:Na+ symporter